MVKTEEIENLMKVYIDDGKQISAFEALYMWSKGKNSATIAGFLLNKYNSVEGLDSITSDLNNLDIKFIPHKLIHLPSGAYQCDAFLPELNLIERGYMK